MLLEAADDEDDNGVNVTSTYGDFYRTGVVGEPLPQRELVFEELFSENSSAVRRGAADLQPVEPGAHNIVLRCKFPKGSFLCLENSFF